MTTAGSSPDTVDADARPAARDLLCIADLSVEQLVRFLDPEPTSERLDGSFVVDVPAHLTHISTAVHEAISGAGGRVVTTDWPGLWVDRMNPMGARLHPPLSAAVVATDHHQRLLEYRRRAGVPIVNAGTDTHHPLKVLADLLTIRELVGRLRGASIAYVGPPSAYRRSLVEAAVRTGVDLRVVVDHRPDDELVAELDEARPIAACFGSSLRLVDPTREVVDVDAVVGDAFTFGLIATSIHLPLALTGAAAGGGASTLEGPRSLLFHRQENLQRVIRRVLADLCQPGGAPS